MSHLSEQLSPRHLAHFDGLIVEVDALIESMSVRIRKIQQEDDKVDDATMLATVVLAVSQVWSNSSSELMLPFVVARLMCDRAKEGAQR